MIGDTCADMWEKCNPRKNASAFHSPPFYFVKIRQEPGWLDVSHMPNQPVAALHHTALFQPATKKK